MKVLFLISGGDSGGAKTHLFALLDSLKFKCDVKMVCFMEGVFYKEILERDIDTVLLRQKSRFDLSVINTLTDMVKNEKYDIVHCHGARANFIGAKLKKKISCPVITTMHSDYLLDFDNLYKKIVFTGLNIRALRKMDYYIAVSSSFKKMLINRGFAPNDIFTVYNGINYDDEISYDDKEKFFRRVGIIPKDDEIYIGIIGRHDHVKGHDIFMKGCALVAKKHKNVRFLIAGDHTGEEALVEIAKQEGVLDRFHFCGFIKDIYSFINVIDINTITSRCESFPYVMLEGARLKKPLVASDVGGISDLVEDGKTGFLFESENYKQFAEKLSVLIENSELRQKMGEEIYKRATAVFSAENLASEHMKIYKSVLRYYCDDKKYDIALSGYYGFNNSGDDALLFSIMRDFKKIKEDTRFLVLTKRPKKGREVCMADTIQRFKPLSLRKALGKSKMLISGGGSLIQDATSSKSLYYYLYVMKLAKRMGCKVFAYANGIGPVKEKNRKIVKKVLEKADKITLREQMSADELLKICPNAKFEVTADPAIGLEVKNNKLFEILEEAEIYEKNIIGISVRGWERTDKDFIDKMKVVVNKAQEKYGLFPVFIPMKYPSDVKIAKELCKACGRGFVIDKQYGVHTVAAFISSCKIVLAMRLHTLIFAAGNCVPCIGISYDPKIDGFMEYMGQEKFLSAENFDMEKASEYINDIMTNYDDTVSKLCKKAAEMKELAFKNAELAAEMIDMEG